MPRNDIPQEVLHFIERRIDSVPHIEALLLLWGAPTRQWTDSEIAARVYVSSDQARTILAGLARSGLIMQCAPEGFTYNPAWDETRLMDKVATAYRGHLVLLSSLIHAKSASLAVQDFARAFQFKLEN
jgi:hypothetical protein